MIVRTTLPTRTASQSASFNFCFDSKRLASHNLPLTFFYATNFDSKK